MLKSEILPKKIQKSVIDSAPVIRDYELQLESMSSKRFQEVVVV